MSLLHIANLVRVHFASFDMALRTCCCWHWHWHHQVSIRWADAAAAEAAAAAAAAAAKDAASAVERQAQVEVAQTKVTAAQVEIAAQIKLLTLAVQERTQALNGALPGSEPGRHGNRVAVAAVASNTAAARTRSTHPDCWAKLFLPGGAALWIDPTTGVIEDAGKLSSWKKREKKKLA